MNSRITIQEELQELNSPIPYNTGMAPFSLPAGYFDGLAASVMAKIKTSGLSAADEIAELSPLLSGITRKNPLSVPEGYFESSFPSVSAFASEEQSTVLNEIGKAMPYQVPAGYFEQLHAGILSQVKPHARVIPMYRKTWMRMAAAAVIAGIMLVSGIAYFTNRQDIPVDNPQWVAKQLKNVSDSELDEFVRTSGVSQASSATVKNTPVRTADVNNLLKDVPDTELDAFLEQIPSDDLEMGFN